MVPSACDFKTGLINKEMGTLWKYNHWKGKINWSLWEAQSSVCYISILIDSKQEHRNKSQWLRMKTYFDFQSLSFKQIMNFQNQGYWLPWDRRSVSTGWVPSTFWRCIYSDTPQNGVLSCRSCSHTPLTCYEANGGAVATAQFWVSPCYHGNSKVVVPCWQQIGYPLKRERRQKSKGKNPIFGIELLSLGHENDQ